MEPTKKLSLEQQIRMLELQAEDNPERGRRGRHAAVPQRFREQSTNNKQMKKIQSKK